MDRSGRLRLAAMGARAVSLSVDEVEKAGMWNLTLKVWGFEQWE